MTRSRPGPRGGRSHERRAPDDPRPQEGRRAAAPTRPDRAPTASLLGGALPWLSLPPVAGRLSAEFPPGRFGFRGRGGASEGERGKGGAAVGPFASRARGHCRALRGAGPSSVTPRARHEPHPPDGRAGARCRAKEARRGPGAPRLRAQSLRAGPRGVRRRRPGRTGDGSQRVRRGARRLFLRETKEPPALPETPSRRWAATDGRDESHAGLAGGGRRHAPRPRCACRGPRVPGRTLRRIRHLFDGRSCGPVV